LIGHKERTLVLEATRKIARAFDLGPDETQMVKRLDRQRFEQRVVELRSA
jgi:hypothetical protein